MVFRLWLNNKIELYERFYKLFQDVISDIGGILESINFIALFVSYLYNNYIIIYDTQVLLFSLNKNFDENINIVNHKKTKNYFNDINSTNNNFNISKIEPNKSDIFNNKVENKEKEKEKEELKNNLLRNLNITKNDDNNISNNNININNKIEELKIKEERKETQIKSNEMISEKKEKEKVNNYFFKFIIYKMCCGKKFKNTNINLYKDIREKIISEEEQFKNCFYINKLKAITNEINPSLY